MQRVTAWLVGVVLLAHMGTASALDNEFSIGMAFPSPTGLSAKKWTSKTKAIDMFAAWSTKEEELAVHFDYLTHDFTAIEMEPGSMPFYYGLGFRVRTEEGKSTKIGVRIPLGVSYLMEEAPLDIFGELGPRADVIPNTSFDMDIMLGIRYRIR